MFAPILALVLCFISVQAKVRNELVLLGDEKIGSAVRSPVPRKTKDQLPTNFDYRLLGLLTTDLNQHIPTYWY